MAKVWVFRYRLKCSECGKLSLVHSWLLEGLANAEEHLRACHDGTGIIKEMQGEKRTWILRQGEIVKEELRQLF